LWIGYGQISLSQGIGSGARVFCSEVGELSLCDSGMGQSCPPSQRPPSQTCFGGECKLAEASGMNGFGGNFAPNA